MLCDQGKPSGWHVCHEREVVGRMIVTVKEALASDLEAVVVRQSLMGFITRGEVGKSLGSKLKDVIQSACQSNSPRALECLLESLHTIRIKIGTS
jgi:hypothetical protein